MIEAELLSRQIEHDAADERGDRFAQLLRDELLERRRRRVTGRSFPPPAGPRLGPRQRARFLLHASSKASDKPGHDEGDRDKDRDE